MQMCELFIKYSDRGKNLMQHRPEQMKRYQVSEQCINVLNIHANYSLMSEEEESKPSNVGQTEVQKWNQMSSLIQLHHSSCILLSASCPVHSVNPESVSV